MTPWEEEEAVQSMRGFLTEFAARVAATRFLCMFTTADGGEFVRPWFGKPLDVFRMPIARTEGRFFLEREPSVHDAGLTFREYRLVTFNLKDATAEYREIVR